MSSVAIAEKLEPKRLLLLALVIAVFATGIIDVLTPITLLQIAQTFSILPGTASQLSAFNVVAAVVTALLLGGLSLRISHRTIVLTGVTLIAVCALGVFLAPSFQLAQAFYPLNGIGSVLVSVMATTFIGEFYPLEKKGKTIGLLAATGSLAVLIGAPVTGLMASIGGWRSILIWFVLPISIASLVFVFFLIPSRTRNQLSAVAREPFLKGFKQVITNKSAVACLASAFLVAVFLGSGTFGTSFLIQTFEITMSSGGIITLVGAAFAALGAYIGGRLINRLGRKRLAFTAGLIAILLSLCSYFIPNLWNVLALRWSSAFFGLSALTAGSNLNLEQIPKFRGTIISLGSALGGIGAALGITIGGTVLNFYNNPIIGYPAMGLILCSVGIFGSIILLLFAKDPYQNQTGQNHKLD